MSTELLRNSWNPTRIFRWQNPMHIPERWDNKRYGFHAVSPGIISLWIRDGKYCTQNNHSAIFVQSGYNSENITISKRCTKKIQICCYGHKRIGKTQGDRVIYMKIFADSACRNTFPEETGPVVCGQGIPVVFRAGFLRVL